MEESKNNTEEEKKFYWLTTDSQSNYRSLKIEPVKRTAFEKHMGDCLWFEDNEGDMAKAFLKDVKLAIKSTYERYGKKATWMTSEWINN